MPEVHRKADVAGPEGVATTAELIARLAALGYSGCGERSRAFEPHRIACSAMELEKSIAIAACAMTEIGALGEWACFPSQRAAADQQLLELWRCKWGVRQRRDHAGSAVAMLTIEILAVDSSSP